VRGPFQTIGKSTRPEFSGTTVRNGTSYYYVVSSENATGESGDSVVVNARPGAFVAAINCGGDAAAQFGPDANFSGGRTSDTRDPIAVEDVDAPAPQSVYRTTRYGGNLAYTFDGLKPGAAYLVRLHFAELNFSNPGQRVFHILINGGPVLENFDIVAVSGGKQRAVVREFTSPSDASGKLVISFKGVKDIGSCNGIEILHDTKSN
jgi:hypothetical protein